MEKERREMKKKLLVLMLGLAMILSFSLLAGCGSNDEAQTEEPAAEESADPVAECAALIDAIYVQNYTEDTTHSVKLLKQHGTL